MGDFVANYAANTTIIDRHIGIGIKEGGLQNGGREDDLIDLRVVIGVYGLGEHAPFLAIDRTIHAAHLIGPVKRM